MVYPQANVRGCFDGEIGLSAERALHWGPYAHALVTAMRACAGSQIPDVNSNIPTKFGTAPRCSRSTECFQPTEKPCSLGIGH